MGKIKKNSREENPVLVDRFCSYSNLTCISLGSFYLQSLKQIRQNLFELSSQHQNCLCHDGRQMPDGRQTTYHDISSSGLSPLELTRSEYPTHTSCHQVNQIIFIPKIQGRCYNHWASAAVSNKGTYTHRE